MIIAARPDKIIAIEQLAFGDAVIFIAIAPIGLPDKPGYGK